MTEVWNKQHEYYRARDLAKKLGQELRDLLAERQRSKLIRLPPHQRLVLGFFAERDPYCQLAYDFATVCADTGLSRNQVARACKALRRLGFTKYERGLFTDDGTPAGAGYGVTKCGMAWWTSKEVQGGGRD